MSFDPYGYQDSTPPASGGPPDTRINSGSSQGGPGSADPSAQAEALYRQAKEKVTLPAVFLIIVGVFNLLPGGYLIVNGLFVSSLTPEQLQTQMERQNAAMKDQFKELAKQGYTPADIQKIAIYGCEGTGGAAILASLLMIIGGIRMIQLRNFGLAVFASILAAVPFISCLGCCGLGQIVGIWSLIVLLSPHVRMAFR
jgi:hypothetical protein